MTIALEEINRVKLISKPVGLLPYIIITSSNRIVATAKRQQALATKIKSISKGKIMFKIPFKLESGNNVKAIIKDR